jgi:arylsulfatase
MFGHRALWQKGWKAVTYHAWDAHGNFDDDKWELYHIDEDFSESHDLAEQQPEKLKEMIDLWWEEAEKYQVLPLDDRTNERFYADKPPRDKDRKTFTYYPGTAMVPASGAPPTRNRSHTITAEVDIPEGGAEGVLIAHGGRFAGYALYVRNNRLVYDHNYLGMEHHIVTSEKDLPTGPSTLRFDFKKTGEHQGTGILYVNGEKVGESEIPRTVPVRFGSEGLEVGRDTATPVSESYSCPFTFTGTLKKVVVEVNGNPHQDPEGDFRTEMAQQ